MREIVPRCRSTRERVDLVISQTDDLRPDAKSIDSTNNDGRKRNCERNIAMWVAHLLTKCRRTLEANKAERGEDRADDKSLNTMRGRPWR